MTELDWRQKDIISNLSRTASYHGFAPDEVVSIKIRFLKSRDDDQQLYLGGHDYALIDQYVDGKLLGIPAAQGNRRSVEYKHHETGPELLGYTADVIGIIGGLFGFWSWLKSELASKSNDNASSNALDNGSKISIELRRLNSDGELIEVLVTQASAQQDLDHKAIKKALEAVVGKKRKPNG